MKNFEISAYGVEEMSSQEIKSVDGGVWGIVWFIVGACLADAIANPRGAASSFKGGMNSAMKYVR